MANLPNTCQQYFTANYLSLVRRSLFLVILTCVLFSGGVFAGGISPELQSKIDSYKQKLEKWASNPTVIKAVETANSQSANISNDKWTSLPASDATVMSYQTSDAGKLLTDWQQDKSLGKLFIRDMKGNLVAGSKKPAIFNIADRAPYTKAMGGETWNSQKVKPDPTTKVDSVQVSTPVMSNGKKIGIIHMSVAAN